MIKSCSGCRAYSQLQGATPSCELGYKLLFPYVEQSKKLIRVCSGDIRPVSGNCPKPRTVKKFVELLKLKRAQP